MTTEALNGLTRRQIRYFLFRKKTEVTEGTPAPKSDAASDVYAHYESLRKFPGWETFAAEWDIGIDTVDMMILRPEKWWCFGIAREHIVKRRHQNVDSVLEGAKFLLAKGFAEQAQAEPFSSDEYLKKGFRINYQEILQTMEARRQWR